MTTAILPPNEVRVDGQVVAWAESEFVATQSGNDVQVALHVAGGQQPSWARRQLMHDVLDRAVNARAQRLWLTAPIGDSVILALIRDRCGAVTTRAAGASCLIEADLPGEEVPTGFSQWRGAPDIDRAGGLRSPRPAGAGSENNASR